MSFHTAEPLAQSLGIHIAGLMSGNPEDEAVAAQILIQAMPDSLGMGYDCLVQIAQARQGLSTPVDECLHCTLEGMCGEDEVDAALANIRRVAMFDVPRQLFAQQHGLWVYWLYGSAFVLSATQVVDLGWAFRRHAYRLQWRLTKKQPGAEMSADAARAYVRQYLLGTAKDGLDRLRADYRRELEEGIKMPDIAVKGPLFEPVTAWFGSLTGGELLREELGREQPLVNYNCCSPSTDHEPSPVKQLQNQSGDTIDC